MRVGWHHEKYPRKSVRSAAQSPRSAAADALLCLSFCSVTRGRVLARALRLLFAQLKFLKLDAANAHLRMLARTMGRDQAVECALAPCCKTRTKVLLATFARHPGASRHTCRVQLAVCPAAINLTDMAHRCIQY